MLRNYMVLFTICLLMSACHQSPEASRPDDAPLYRQANAPIEARVDDLLARMTLEEKVAQMRIFRARLGVELGEEDDLALSDNVKPRLVNGIGGVKKPGEKYSPDRAALLNNKFQKYIIENNRLGIPALFVTEAAHGVSAFGCTQFARPIAQASSWDTNIVQRIYDATGREARLRGLNMTHTPQADLARDPRYGRMADTFGEDTHLATRMVVSAVKGLQGAPDSIETHIGAVTKHFMAYSQVAGGKNFAAVEISPRTLRDEILPPFKAAIQEADTLGIMPSHCDINGVAAHANRELLTDILRTELGFKGYVVSDARDVERLYTYIKVAGSNEEAALLGLTAGVDIDLYSENAYSSLPEMVKEDPSLIQYIDRSVRRVLRTKFKLGLFENPYADVKQAMSVTRNKDAIALAVEADEAMMILLKNEGDVLPLSEDKSMTVALVGPMLSDEAKGRFEKTVSDNIEFIAIKGFELTDKDPNVAKLTDPEENRRGIQEILETTAEADVIVVFLGGDRYTTREANFGGALGDRDSIDPVGQQDELLLELKETGKPVVVVLKHRRTLSINTIAEEADAILDCWELSEFGDFAIAKTLFGQVVPSGKLPVTVPRSVGQLPCHYSQKAMNFHKQYLFADSTPIYPFGFGLSYTTFELSNYRISDESAPVGSSVTVSVDVTNTGDRKGKEVVQLYLRDEVRSITRPMRELKAFEKIELSPGETRTVNLSVTPEMMSFTGLDMTRTIEPGVFSVFVGNSSATQEKLSYTLTDK